MRVVTAAEIDGLLDYPGLIAAIRAAFRANLTAPPRHHHRIPRPGSEATLLLMPAWHQGADGGFIGVKLVSVFPDNATRSLPSVMGTYLLMAGDSGVPLAALDGVALTLWRTAATSALVSGALARHDASHLAMIGAGALAPHLIRAHASVRPITHVTVWNRTLAHAERLAAEMTRPGFTVTATADREAAIRAADIVLRRDAQQRSAGRGRLAEARHARRSGRRLHAADARGPTTPRCAGQRSTSTAARA